MVASVTRLLFFVWFALLAALLAAGLEHGWSVAILAGLYALVLGHPTLLAIELVIARIVSSRANVGGSGVPTATLVRAWLVEWRTSTVVFGWRLPWGAQRWPDHLPRSARGLRGVVLVHGLICHRGVWNPWLERLTKLDRAFVAVSLEPVFGDIDACAEAVERAVRRVESVTGLAPIIVAHSMGGLVARAWLRTREGRATSDGHEHAARVITIATPHRGTWIARFALAPNGRQMRIDGPWMRALAEATTPQLAAMFTCWWSACDQMVYPAPTAVLPDSESHHLRGSGHLAMVDREEVWAELRRRLAN